MPSSFAKSVDVMMAAAARLTVLKAFMSSGSGTDQHLATPDWSDSQGKQIILLRLLTVPIISSVTFFP
jgi:hypothetical protein